MSEINEIDRLREILSRGKWEAMIHHCPPPRSRRDNPLKHSSLIRLNPLFVSEADALAYAERTIAGGWAGSIIIHRESARPMASFRLSSSDLDQLARAARPPHEA